MPRFREGANNAGLFKWGQSCTVQKNDTANKGQRGASYSMHINV